MTSIFSKIVAGEIPCYKVHEIELFLAFLDITPIAKGHVLVIPKNETDYIFDIEDVELSAMIIFAKEVARKIKTVFPCKKVGVTVIGLEVPHAHIHLVPLQSVHDIDFSRPKLKFEKQDFEKIAGEIRSKL